MSSPDDSAALREDVDSVDGPSMSPVEVRGPRSAAARGSLIRATEELEGPRSPGTNVELGKSIRLSIAS